MNEDLILGQVEPQLLQRLPLFKDLTARQLREAADLLSLAVIPAGTALMNQNDSGEVIYILVSGGVKVTLQSPRGEPSVIHIGGPGEVFGEMAVVEGQTRFATVTTLEECGVCQIRSEVFWTTLWDFPPVPYNLLVQLNKRVRSVTAQAEALKYLGPGQRVLQLFSNLFEQYGRPGTEEGDQILPFKLDAKELASFAGTRQSDVDELWERWMGEGSLKLDVNGHFVASNLNMWRV